MKAYFAYVRVSTARQGEHGTSPQEQRHAITGYALRNNLEVAEWYQESESAAKQGRPAFTAMLRDLRRRRIAGVIIHKIDRGARNLKDWAVLLDLVDEGIELHFAHETVDLTSRGGRLTANIQAVMAADYSRNLSDEVKKGQLGRLRQGYYPFRAPIGYLDQGRAKPKAIDPVRGPLVREAFERYSTRAYSVDMLRREMAARGLLRGRAPLSRNAFTSLLHNPFYSGLMRLRPHAEPFAGNHEPLVPRALFDRVQAILTGKGGGKTHTHDFLFRRRLRCASCNRTITGEVQKGHAYYRCHAGTCRGTSAREDRIGDKICEALLCLRLEGVELGDFRDVLRELTDEERSTERVRSAAARLEIAKVDTRISRLTDFLMDATLDKATYVDKKEELLLERQALLETQAKGSSYWAGLGEKFELGFAAYLSYEIGNPDEQRNIVDQVSSNLLLSQKEPVFTLKFPYKEWENWSRTHKCGPSNARLRTKDEMRRFLLSLHKSHGAGHASGHDIQTTSSPRRHPSRQHYPERDG
jgi:DNA invertase Pin-like site-specific DNA recombinase